MFDDNIQINALWSEKYAVTYRENPKDKPKNKITKGAHLLYYII